MAARASVPMQVQVPILGYRIGHFAKDASRGKPGVRQASGAKGAGPIGLGRLRDQGQPWPFFGSETTGLAETAQLTVMET